MLPGMFEAGTFPAMWAHLTKFYAGGPGLAAAWGFIGAAQPLAQVTQHLISLLPCTTIPQGYFPALDVFCSGPSDSRGFLMACHGHD